jgi:microcystin-dependent protein
MQPIPFIGEIRAVAFNFPPTGWAFCNGQLMPLSQNTALFSLLGTMYGGDGKSTFALPNIQQRAVIHAGQGLGLSNYDQGEEGGTETTTLLQSEIPAHNHRVQAASDPAEQLSPTPNSALARSAPGNAWQTNSSANLVNMAPEKLAVAGGSLPHNNLPPTLVLNFIIALQGAFPQRPTTP